MTALALHHAAVIERVRSTAAAIGQIVDVHALDRPEDEARAGELLQAIHTVLAQAEDARKEAKAPHLQAGRDVDDAFRGPRKELERVRDLLKRRLAEKAREREAARLAAVAEARAAAKAGDHETVNAALERIDIAGLDRTPAGVSERWTWAVDQIEISKVPIEFLAVRMDLIRAEIATANKEGRPPAVPGITFKKEAQIVARRADR